MEPDQSALLAELSRLVTQQNDYFAQLVSNADATRALAERNSKAMVAFMRALMVTMTLIVFAAYFVR